MDSESLTIYIYINTNDRAVGAISKSVHRWTRKCEESFICSVSTHTLNHKLPRISHIAGVFTTTTIESVPTSLFSNKMSWTGILNLTDLMIVCILLWMTGASVSLIHGLAISQLVLVLVLLVFDLFEDL